MSTPLPGKAAPRSKHFDFRAVAPGTYAAIATERGLAVGNAGVADLGDLTLVFDTLSNHLAAEDLRKAAEAATGRPAALVVNSHAHRDHTKGNQVFRDAVIVATRATAEIMTRNWEARTERVRKEGLDPIRRGLETEFEAWESNPLTTAGDRILWESYRNALLHGIEEYRLKLPTVSFDSSLRFYGRTGTAEALTFGGGHSASDAVLHVPDPGVVYLGDLLFVGVQPFLGDGDPERFLQILDRIEALDAKTLVPGHGPVGSNRDLQPMRDYVHAVERAVRDAGDSDAGLTRAAKSVPAPFASWKWRAFWMENVKSLHEKSRTAT